MNLKVFVYHGLLYSIMQKTLNKIKLENRKRFPCDLIKNAKKYNKTKWNNRKKILVYNNFCLI